MKHKITAIVLLCLILSGCQNSVVSEGQALISYPAAETTELTAETETAETPDTTEATEQKPEFTGLTKGTDIQFCNTSSCLNMGGMICHTEDGELLSKDGNIIIKNDSMEKVLLEGAEPQCINVVGDRVYFINRSDKSRIYSVGCDGDNSSRISEDSALLLMMSDKGMIYLNEHKELIISTNEKTTIITDKEGVWVSSYGEWLIYTEFQNGCAVKAYNTDTGEYVHLLDYGFYPTVYGNYLYYQEKTHGNICRISLADGEQSTVLNEWGQQFCFIDNSLFFLGSQGVKRLDLENEGGCELLYKPDDENTVIDNLFVCDDELYLSQGADNKTALFRIDMTTGEKNEV